MILKIREASERKSLHDVDNIAADGSSGIEKLKQIVSEMEDLGVCGGGGGGKFRQSDHCRNFALSDATDKLLQIPGNIFARNSLHQIDCHFRCLGRNQETLRRD
jgi:hypothetical protein